MTNQNGYVVVGAGLLGLAAARALSRRGRDVTVLEQAEVGHDGAGSKGSCRIFRLGYPDARYVALARQARGLWRQLEDESGRQILLPRPQLTFGGQLAEVHEAMRAAGAPCEMLTAAQAAEQFPGITAGGPVLLETESCVTAASQAMQALAAAVPQVRTGVRVTSLADDGRAVRVETDAGPLLARTVIVCAGPGTAALLAGAGISVPLTATMEQVAYLAPPGGAGPHSGAGPPGGAGPELPIFICHDARTPYGLPEPDSGRYKIGVHRGGRLAGPRGPDQASDQGLLRELADLARRYLPGLDPEPVSAERCVYDNSPDEDFIVDRTGNVVIGAGTSGHGFKFGPLLGEWLADLADGRPADVPGQFSLARFSGARFSRARSSGIRFSGAASRRPPRC